MYIEHEEIVSIWKKELDNYQFATGNSNNDSHYMNQSIEIDAIAIEKYMMKELLNVDVIPHNLIKDAVNDVKIVIDDVKFR